MNVCLCGLSTRHTHVNKQEQESMATESLVSVVRKYVFQDNVTVYLRELITII